MPWALSDGLYRELLEMLGWWKRSRPGSPMLRGRKPQLLPPTPNRKVRLTSNLGGDSGGSGSTSTTSATGRFQKLNRTTREYEDDPDRADEVTVYDTQGAFCGVEGEIIEVRHAGPDSEGSVIWEVVRGGAMHQTGTLAEQLTHGETVSVNISGRSGVSVEATDIFLPDAYSGTTPIGLDAGTLVSLNYNTRPDSPRWEVTGAPGDQCETCPDPCV
jgi:hypothetical protein